MTRFVSALALAATLVGVATGCGGGGGSAEEKWANSVCTYVGDWQSELKQVQDDIAAKLQSPKAGTLDAIKADVRKAVDATNQMANKLKALGAPKTESGAKAKQELDAYGSQLQATAKKAEDALQAVPSGATVPETVQKLAPLAPELQSLAASTTSTLNAVQATGSDIKKGFDKANACKQFR